MKTIMVIIIVITVIGDRAEFPEADREIAVHRLVVQEVLLDRPPAVAEAAESNP